MWYHVRGEYYRLSLRDASAGCKGEACFCQADIELGMLRYVLDIVGPGELHIRGQLMDRSP